MCLCATVSCGKTAEPIEMPFGLYIETPLGADETVDIRRGAHWRHLANSIKQEAFEKCWAHSPLRAAARPFTRCRYRYCRTPPAHRCPQRQRRQLQRQRVTEGTAMSPWNGPSNLRKLLRCKCAAYNLQSGAACKCVGKTMRGVGPTAAASGSSCGRSHTSRQVP